VSQVDLRRLIPRIASADICILELPQILHSSDCMRSDNPRTNLFTNHSSAFYWVNSTANVHTTAIAHKTEATNRHNT